MSRFILPQYCTRGVHLCAHAEFPLYLKGDGAQTRGLGCAQWQPHTRAVLGVLGLQVLTSKIDAAENLASR